jgi:hypothetical protein
MQEDNSTQFQTLGQIWRSAHLIRAAELGSWLRQYFENRRQSRLQKQASLSTTVMTLNQSATG